ncbi:hypothetical protein JOF29_001518 [Kribbella aluminosa]|uniref:Uncharacterized protein n=1 Tax=Kribbella aluminosa TaxID=416017 RepID=A0ABS4UFM3_9ACTN|nr:hypothetical protein [Kribbella aluminosa]MBP2350435.1 hypothetical protein [Kribbella aluminosa]
MQAVEANAALGVLDRELARAGSPAERVAGFEAAYRHVAEWRYQLALEGKWVRPGASAEDVRARIEFGMNYRLTPTIGRREPGSPAFEFLTELERVALDRLDGQHELQNVVTMRDGRTVNGNLLHFVPAPQGFPDEVITQTAGPEDRDVLRRAAFEALAELEEAKADPKNPEHRQAFADAAYFLVQGPEFQRGSDAIMRTFLVAAHARVFDVAPVLPQAIDLDGMVRGQDGFNQVMRDQLRLVPKAAQNNAAAAQTTESTRPGANRAGGASRSANPRGLSR